MKLKISNTLLKYLIIILITHTLFIYIYKYNSIESYKLIFILLTMFILVDKYYKNRKNLLELYDNNSRENIEIDENLFDDFNIELSNKIKLDLKNSKNDIECNNILKNLYENSLIDNDKYFLLKFIYQIGNLKILYNYNKINKLNNNIILDLIYGIETNSYRINNALLNKYLNKNLISKEVFEKILNFFPIEYSDANDKLALLLDKYDLSIKDIYDINNECLLDVNKCINVINKKVIEKKLDTVLGKELIESYSKNINNNILTNIDQTNYYDKSNNLYNSFDKLDNLEESYNIKKTDYDKFDHLEKSYDIKKINNNEKNNENNNNNKLDNENNMLINKNLDNNYIDIQKNKHTNLKKKIISNEMIYSQYPSEYYESLKKGVSMSFNNKNEYLETNKWKPFEKEQLKCKNEYYKCNTCDNNYILNSNYINVFDFDNSRKILPNDNINIEYIEKLNKGI